MAREVKEWDPGGVFERFTDRARRVLVLAQEEAHQMDHGVIGTEHILLGLIGEGEGVAACAIEQLGVSLEDVRGKVAATVGRSWASSGSIPFTPRAKKVLELSLREALQLGHNYIGTEHILLGLIGEGQGVAAQVLISLDLDLARVRQQVVHLLSGYQGIVACSFCGRRPPESGQLVAGQKGAYVCEHCINDLKARLGSIPEEVDGLSSAVVMTGRMPDDEESARSEIARAFRDVFVLSSDRRTVPSIEGGDHLGPCLKEAQERHAALRRTDQPVTIENVEFVDEEHAIVSFALSLEGLSSEPRRGDALVVDSTWKVARMTFCQLMELAGVKCPPKR